MCWTRGITFKEIIEKLLNSIGKKRLLIPLPIFFAKLIAFFFEKFPKTINNNRSIKTY